MVNAGKMPAATIMDYAPMVNIAPFGMCLSFANPVVAAATAGALGVFTPKPCIPATTAPWVPGAVTVSHGKMPALDSDSMCMWAGVITLVSPGQMQQQSRDSVRAPPEARIAPARREPGSPHLARGKADNSCLGGGGWYKFATTRRRGNRAVEASSNLEG
jgi:hypothetical protein